MKKKITTLILIAVLCLMPVVFSACKGDGFNDVEQMTCNCNDQPNSKDNPLKYNLFKGTQQEIVKFLNDHDRLIDYLLLTDNQANVDIYCPAVNTVYSLLGIIRAGATVQGFDPTKAGKGKTMVLNYKGYSLVLYYDVE